MREFFDYDPLTGVAEYIEEADGKLHITYEQDVEPVLEFAKALRNEGVPDENWQKNECSVYAVLPATVLAAMAKKGIRFLDQNDIGKVLDEINQNYPWLKCTYKTHAIR